MLWSESPTTQRLRCACGQELDENVLRMIGVLVLVDENKAEPLLIVGQDFGEGPQHIDGEHQQIIEVHRGGLDHRC